MDAAKPDATPLTEENKRLLHDARINFAAFYRKATAYETQLMDALVLTHGVLDRGLHIPADLARPLLRAKLERLDEKNRKIFLLLCDAVRRCRCFAELVDEQKQQIERTLFEAPQRQPSKPGRN